MIIMFCLSLTMENSGQDSRYRTLTFTYVHVHDFFHPGHYFRLVNDTQYYYMNSLCCNEESITLFSYPTYLKTIVIIQKTYVDIKFSAHEAFLE